MRSRGKLAYTAVGFVTTAALLATADTAVAQALDVGLAKVPWGQILPPLALGIATFYIVQYIQNLVRREQAYRNMLSSPYVSEGIWLSFPTATGSVAGKITGADRRRIKVEHHYSIRYIDITRFASMDVVVLKRPPKWAVEEMDHPEAQREQPPMKEPEPVQEPEPTPELEPQPAENS